MRGEIALIIAFVTLCAASDVLAVGDKVFTSSGQILPGEEWSNVHIYNDDTVVDMLGGLVDTMSAYDESALNLTAGTVFTLATFELSTADISGGELGGVHARGDSLVIFSDDAACTSLSARDFGTANMMGGTTEYARAGDSAALNLYGGLITDSLDGWGSAAINVYGYGFNYYPSGGSWEGGQLTGFWLDDTPFTIDLYDPDTYSHINLVPEPSSLALLALGSLLLRRRR